MPMNQEMKAKWVEALRSGKYAQTRNRLRDDKGYCCLGVLVDIMDGPDSWDNREPMLSNPRYFSKEGEGVGLDSKRLKDLGVDSTENTRDKVSIVSTLIKMNDTNRDSFIKIADYIEETVF